MHQDVEAVPGLAKFSVHPIDVAIDGQRVAPRPRDPGVVYIVAPPEVFDVIMQECMAVLALERASGAASHGERVSKYLNPQYHGVC